MFNADDFESMLEMYGTYGDLLEAIQEDVVFGEFQDVPPGEPLFQAWKKFSNQFDYKFRGDVAEMLSAVRTCMSLTSHIFMIRLSLNCCDGFITPTWNSRRKLHFGSGYEWSATDSISR